MKKLSVQLQQDYKTFKTGFQYEFEIKNNLVILSGINGSGKSQLGEIISGKLNNNGHVNISRTVNIDQQSCGRARVTLRTFKNNINIQKYSPNFAPLFNATRNSHQNYDDLVDFQHSSLTLGGHANALKTVIGHEELIKCNQDKLEEYCYKHFIFPNGDDFDSKVEAIFLNYLLLEKDGRNKAADGNQNHNDELFKESFTKNNGFSYKNIPLTPWDFLNEVFKFLGLSYQFTQQTASTGSVNKVPTLNDFQIINTDTGFATHDFNFLSDGEKAIISLTFALLNHKTVKPKILILDEYDAPLNPSLTEAYYKIIDEFFIKNDILVLIITHSIATISMAPQYADFYEVFKPYYNPRIVKVEKDKYSDIRIALESYYLKESELANKIAELNSQITSLQNTNKNMIICEGKTDPVHFREAINKLEITIDNTEFIDFDYDKKGGSSNLKTLLESHAKTVRSNKIIGIFDRDEKDIVDEIELSETKYRHYGNNIYAFCIPKILFKDANEEDIDTHIEIEHYYPIRVITSEVNSRRLFLGSEFNNTGISKCGKYFIKNGSCENQKIKFNHVIDDKVYLESEYNNTTKIEKTNHALSKNDFAEAIKDNKITTNKEDFENFKAIFELINKIITPTS